MRRCVFVTRRGILPCSGQLPCVFMTRVVMSSLVVSALGSTAWLVLYRIVRQGNTARRTKDHNDCTSLHHRSDCSPLHQCTSRRHGDRRTTTAPVRRVGNGKLAARRLHARRYSHRTVSQWAHRPRFQHLLGLTPVRALPPDGTPQWKDDPT